jgi:hypothetical protein
MEASSTSTLEYRYRSSVEALYSRLASVLALDALAFPQSERRRRGLRSIRQQLGHGAAARVAGQCCTVCRVCEDRRARGAPAAHVRRPCMASDYRVGYVRTPKPGRACRANARIASAPPAHHRAQSPWRRAALAVVDGAVGYCAVLRGTVEHSRARRTIDARHPLVHG